MNARESPDPSQQDILASLRGPLFRRVALQKICERTHPFIAGEDESVVMTAPQREELLGLARRLEDSGIAALTIHCRTAKMGHTGSADWTWAQRAKESVSIPVIVNGDVKSADDAQRAIDSTGCQGVMIGRRAIEHPWIFREANALLREGKHLAPPTDEERIELCKTHLRANVEERGEPYGVRCTRRHLSGYLSGLRGASALRRELNLCDTLEGCLAILDAWRDRAVVAA